VDWFFGLLALALLVLGLALIITNGLILLRGAPYLPSLRPHTKTALDLLNLKPGQVVYDLGCGDGRFLKAAARRGIKVVGYELNPFIFAYAWLSTRRYRKLVSVRFGDFWQADISQADAVYVFLFDRFMAKLDAKLKAEAKTGLKLASHTFKIPRKKPTAQDYGVYLYKY
jgi:cyclopropane fatty-acyl-phospholipid synthase-like methyltransferase